MVEDPATLNYVNLENVIGDKATELNRAGITALILILSGMAILFIALGICSLGFGVISSWVVAGIGGMTIVLTLWNIYFIEFRKARKLAMKMQESVVILTSIQKSAILFIDNYHNAQLLVCRHIDRVRPLLDDLHLISDLAGNIPILKDLVLKLKEIEKVSSIIVNSSEDSKKCVSEIRKSLSTLDVKLLTDSINQLPTLHLRLFELLSAK